MCLLFLRLLLRQTRCKNFTNEDITATTVMSDPNTADDPKANYDWRVDGTSIAFVKLQF